MNAPKPTNEPTSKSRLRLWLRLLKTARVIEAEVRENLRRDHDTTLPRFDVMAALMRAEAGLKMSELSDELRVSNGNVTGIVDRLVQDALVVRVPVKGDRRATRVALTQKGQDDFAGLAAAHEDWIDDLLHGVDPGAAAAMGEHLRAIVQRIDERNQA